MAVGGWSGAGKTSVGATGGAMGVGVIAGGVLFAGAAGAVAGSVGAAAAGFAVAVSGACWANAEPAASSSANVATAAGKKSPSVRLGDCTIGSTAY
jgi:hypothetical protein